VQSYIRERALLLAGHILSTSDTVRQTAKKHGISKSTVHKDMVERLPKINPVLADDVQEILAQHKAERHLRGGEATKQKYAQRRKK
jgi:putative DeoR family transcriptional regulator (stage III sporulation protein D)